MSPARGLTSIWSRPARRYSTGILDRDDRHLGLVELLQAGVERRRLARAGGTDDDDRPVGLRDRVLERGAAARPQLEVVERLRDARLAEQPERHLLPVGGRKHGDADVDGLSAPLHRDAAVLRHAALCDVQAGHDLEAADDRGRVGARDGGDLSHDAVDACPHDDAAILRGEVDVGGANVERLPDGAVDEEDGRRVCVPDVLPDVGRRSSSISCSSESPRTRTSRLRGGGRWRPRSRPWSRYRS